MAKKDYAINFRAQIGSLDKASINWAEKAFRESIPDISVNLGIKPSEVQNVVNKVKYAYDEINKLHRLTTEFKGADGQIITKKQVGTTISDIKTIETTFTQTQDSIKKQMVDVSKELKKVVDESLKNLGNKDIVSQLDTKASSLQDKFEKLSSQLKNLSKSDSFDSKEFSIKTYEPVKESYQKRAILEEANAVKQLELSWKKVESVRLSIAKLDTPEGNAYYSEQKKILEEILGQREQEALALANVNNETQRRFNQLENETAEKEKLINVQAQEQEIQKQSISQLKEYETNLNRINQLEIARYKLERQMSSNRLFDIPENKNSVAAYTDEISALKQANSAILEKANSEYVLEKYSDAAAKAERALATAMTATNAAGKMSSNIFLNVAEGLKEAAGRIIDYTLVYRSLWGLIQLFQSSMKTIYELDTVMTDIQMVTGQTAEETNKLQKEYSGLASELGATTTEIAKGATEWLRQGKSIKDTTELLRASTIMSKVGKIEAAQSTELLTSALNGFNLEADQAINIVSKLSAVDLKAATSVEELAIALQRTASSGNLAGVSMDTLVGWIAAVSEATRKSASTIGESFKTIFARFQNVKAGVDLDENGESVNDVEKVLTRFNISLRNTNGEFRNISDVLNEVNAQWGTLKNTEQAQLATAIAGTHQRENFVSLMQNYGRAIELTETSLNSAGTAEKKFQTYMDSLDAKIKEFKSTWEGLLASEGLKELLKSGIDFGTQLLKILQEVVDNPVARLMIKLAAMSALLSGVGYVLDKINGEWLVQNNLIIKAVKLIRDLIIAQQAYNAAKAIGQTADTVASGTKTAVEIVKTTEGAVDVVETVGKITDVTKTVGRFEKGTITATVATKGLWGAIKLFAKLPAVKLVAILGIPIAIYELLRFTGVLETTKEKIKKYADLKKEAFEKIDSNQSQIDELTSKVDKLNAAEKRRLDTLIAQNKVLENQAKENASEEFDLTYGEDNNGEYGNNSQLLHTAEDLKLLVETQKQLNEAEERALATGEDNYELQAKLKKEIDFLTSSLLEQNDAYKTLAEQSGKNNSQWDALTNTISLVIKGFESLNDLLNASTTVSDENAKSWINLQEALDSINVEFKSQEDTLDLLIKAQKEYNENGYLSADSMSKLLALSPQLTKSIFNQKGEFLGTADAVNVLTKETLSLETAQQYLAQNSEVLNSLESLRIQIESMTASSEAATASLMSLVAASLSISNTLISDQSAKVNAMIANVEKAKKSFGKVYRDSTKESKKEEKKEKEKTPEELAQEQYKADKDTFDHQMLLSQKRKESQETYIIWLKKQMDRANKYANQIRELTGQQDNEYIREAQENWWKYHDELLEIMDDLEKKNREMYDENIRNTEHQLFLAQKNDATIEKQKAFLVQLQNMVHAEAQRLREIGTSENSQLIQDLQKAWWTYEEQKVSLDKEALDKIKENNQKLKDNTEKIWGLAQKIILNGIQDQIDALQAELDMLDEQAEKEDKLLKIEEARKKLAEAKNKTIRIYREGMGFVYEQDFLAVNEAQKDLNEIEKEFADWQKKKDIEAEIKRLEDLKDAWSDALDIADSVSDYNSALELAAKYQSENYNEMLSNVEKFKEEYNKIMKEIQTKIDSPSLDDSNNDTSDSSNSSGNNWGSSSKPNDKYTPDGTLTYDPNIDYQSLINEALKNGQYAAAERLNQERNNKIDGEGLDPSLKNEKPVMGNGNWLGFANGTTGVKNTGIYEVGERGTELALLPRGSGVVDNKDTRTLMNLAKDPTAPFRQFMETLNLGKNSLFNSGGESFNLNGPVYVESNNAEDFIKSIKQKAIQRTTHRGPVLQ